MKILAIETSCDETAVALVDCKGALRQAQGRNLRFRVLKNIVSSQIAVHRPYGGVVPNLAKREHIKNLPKIFKTLYSKFNILNSVDAIAVTVGPGLEPALWAGIEFAKQLRSRINADRHADKRGNKRRPVELIGVNHMEGHLYSNWLPRKEIRNEKLEIRKKSKDSPLISHISFPAIALVVSGGHTILLKMDSLTKWKKLGETRDDAAGEAFDKVARLLGLPYPGGPEIQKLAAKGNPKAINFPRPMLREKNYEFSFSGLKTAVLYYLRDKFSLSQPVSSEGIDKRKTTTANDTGRHNQNLADIAASAQQAIVDVLVGKTIRAAQNFRAKSVLLCGGVSANRALRETLSLVAGRLSLNFHVPDFEYNTDNAAMIAVAAYIQHQKGKKLKISAQPNLNL